MDAQEFGPRMRALTEKQQRFVLAMAADPFGQAQDWARAAGYSDPGGVSSAIRVTAHRIMHDPKVQAAVFEFARSLLDTTGPMVATVGLLRIAQNPNHPRHARALEMVANRVGLHETTEHTVRVEHTDRTGRAMAERIAVLAQQLGMDPAKLLGANEPKLIEAAAEEVKE